MKPTWSGALLINKRAGVTSFGVIEQLQRELSAITGLRKKELPKMGHGGTLDPFATGLLPLCVGDAVKLSRYFLGADKSYSGIFKFGETTIPGDPTAPVSQTTHQIPSSLEEIRKAAQDFLKLPYHQTPPMHSAKKVDGKPLYELARQGIEIERASKLCILKHFDILKYHPPYAHFSVSCTSGTYIRTLAQDFAKRLGSLALLETLHRTETGGFDLSHAVSVEEVIAATQSKTPWPELKGWIPFDELLVHLYRAEATEDEAKALQQGKQNVLFNILKRREPQSQREDLDNKNCVAIYCNKKLVAVARLEDQGWGLERVFNVSEISKTASSNFEF